MSLPRAPFRLAFLALAAAAALSPSGILLPNSTEAATAQEIDITCVGVLPVTAAGQQVTPEVSRCFPTP